MTMLELVAGWRNEAKILREMAEQMKGIEESSVLIMHAEILERCVAEAMKVLAK